MLDFIVNMFRGKPKQPRRKSVVSSQETEDGGVRRVMTLGASDCALVMHENNQCEVVFTKYRDDSEGLTPNEELLMALTVFLKKPEFGEMLVGELNRIVMSGNRDLLKEQKEQREDQNNGKN